MPLITLNLGILAHVDAGKTTLTERLLYASGVIDAVGSVDKGTTQTDWLPLERERGITIRSAVVSFTIDDVVVNLIDTPGHPDFIAEVERVLGVLDGVVLVVSAVEGVQPQTRLLMRVLERLKLPTLLFVNKIDRMGADPEGTLGSIRRRLRLSVVPLGRVVQAGSRAADVVPFEKGDPGFLDDLVGELAQHDEAVLGVIDLGRDLAYPILRNELVRQTQAALVHPVLFGSALSGAGTPDLMAAIAAFLPGQPGDPEGPLSGSVFKIERSPTKERLAYLRLSSGTLRVRDKVQFSGGNEEKVTAISTFADGTLAERHALVAGEIGKVSGMKRVRVGDVLGAPGHQDAVPEFAPPTLATRVSAVRESDGPLVLAALSELAEQDPLIGVRHDPRSGEISVSLYGEVQREVIQATLERDYGIATSFHGVTPLYVERPIGSGEAIEVMHGPGNPFDATIGFRIEPGPPESGVVFEMAVESSSVPLFLFKTMGNFADHIESWVSETLSEGLFGWEVRDCVVTMHRCAYGVADGPPSRRGSTVPSDYRYLTPIVLMEALAAAGSVVCEPLVRAFLEVPSAGIQTILSALGRLGATIEAVSAERELSSIRTVMSSEDAVGLRRDFLDLTSGEGIMDTSFGGYRPREGPPPRRARTTPDPLDRDAYLGALGRRV